MWGRSDEPPGTMEADPPDQVAGLQEKCEENKTKLESVKDIMLKNKQCLKKKEEELEEYSKKLSKLKIKAKASRRSKNDDSSSESRTKSQSDTTTLNLSGSSIESTSDFKTSKNKSSISQRLAEDKKLFEQQSKELIESRKAVEEKVEEIRQQIVNPVLITSKIAHSLIEISDIQDKDNKIAELSGEIVDLRARILDLEENLKEKDSVIDSKTKAITLMSADLSKKGKTTLDTLEDTKDEMRSMQENFVLLETSLKTKNDSLLEQLQERDNRITELLENIQKLEENLNSSKITETVSTLADTKDAMKAMQENFILIESSMKSKNEHLLKQLEEREIKLAEYAQTISHLESGLGIEKQPNTDELFDKVQYLEGKNRKLEDEKYELQKNISDLQDKIVNIDNFSNNGALLEKDNRIAELENLIDELRKSNQLLEEESKSELQRQMNELSEKNLEMSNKITDLEKSLYDLENEKSEILSKLESEETRNTPKDDEKKIQKLTKELDDLNKSMIKLKSQHKNKLKNLQKQIESFKKVSDVNAELVKLGNQVTLLEEEKGNLQLSLVDFDELKVAAGDWQKRIVELESKVLAQGKEIESHVEAISILENQKLDLMQELHSAKQEISGLEAENADSENLRVTAEMKIVDLEEQIDSINKSRGSLDNERIEYQKQIESLVQENDKLLQKLLKYEEKTSSEVGSTESFVRTGSNVDSTESIEALADNDKIELLRKIDALTRENNMLIEKLNRIEEKGSSDAGSTESFERIPDQSENSSRIDALIQENKDLVIKLTKLDEKYITLENKLITSNDSLISDLEKQVKVLSEENEKLSKKISQLTEECENFDKAVEKKAAYAQVDSFKMSEYVVETRIDELFKENSQLVQKLEDLEKLNDSLVTTIQELRYEKEELSTKLDNLVSIKSSEETEKLDETRNIKETDLIQTKTINKLEEEIEKCSSIISEQKGAMDDMKMKLAEKEEELNEKSTQLQSYESSDIDVHKIRRELQDSESTINEWKQKCHDMNIIIKNLEESNAHIQEVFQTLQDENKNLIAQSQQKDVLVNSLKDELDNTITVFETKLKDQTKVIVSYEEEINNLKATIEARDESIQAKYEQIQNYLIQIDSLQDNLNHLDEQLQQKNLTITSLSQELENAKGNTSAVEEDLFIARQKLVEINESLKNSKPVDEYQQVVNTLEEKDILIKELKMKLKKAITEIKSLNKQLETSKIEIDSIKEKLLEEESKSRELLQVNLSLQETIKQLGIDKSELQNKYLELKNSQAESLEYGENTKKELQQAYRSLEQLKMKHTEDTEMQNRRLEDLYDEIQAKLKENENLQLELKQKEVFINEIVSNDIKSTLENQITELKNNLSVSELKIQSQIEKMKKYAAVIQKKKAQNEELENTISQLQESVVLEKAEKEEINKELQIKSIVISENEEKIAMLENQLKDFQSEKEIMISSFEDLHSQLELAKEKIRSLNEEVAQLNEEKEKARELGVRMQVMEAEYMEQLALINSLKAENGFLLSKQTQINERLENVEKESEERRALVEKLEKEKEIQESQKTQETSNELSLVEDGSNTRCSNCSYLQSMINNLEAKLQERDAEIENLDNELHNSIGNLVQMQENLRLSTLANHPTDSDKSLQEIHDDLVVQHNLLIASKQELTRTYEEIRMENDNFKKIISDLQQSITSHQMHLKEIQEGNSGNVIDLQSELQVAIQSKVELENQLTDQIRLLHVENERLVQELEKSQTFIIELEKNLSVLEYEKLKSVKEKLEHNLTYFEASPSEHLEFQDEQDYEIASGRSKREISKELGQSEDLPLFDASRVFGASRTTDSEKEEEIKSLKNEIQYLRDQLQSEQHSSRETQRQLHEELDDTRRKLELVTQELNNFGAQLEAQLSNNESRLEATIVYKNNEISSLQNEITKTQETLVNLRGEYNNLVDIIENNKFNLRELESDKLKYIELVQEYASEIGRMEKIIEHTLSPEIDVDNNQSETANTQINMINIFSKLEKLTNKYNGMSNQIMEIHEKHEINERKIMDLQNEIYEITEEKNNLLSQIQAMSENQPLPLSPTVIREQLTPIEKEKPISGIESSHEAPLHLEEDGWGWNADVAFTDSDPVHLPIVANIEIQLNTKIKEMEEEIKRLQEENEKISEENQNMQSRAVKYVRKLKEYKVQCDNLQQQVKSQISLSGFESLDSAIEEELKSQICTLEKTLRDIQEEHKKTLSEKENLLNRIDVLVAASERFTEMKEKQDIEVHVWQKRNKDLEMKIDTLEKQLQNSDSFETNQKAQSPETNDHSKCQDTIDYLKENLDALASENEELQQLLEQRRFKRDVPQEVDQSVDNLLKKNTDLEADHNKLRTDYEILRKEYEQSLMDANDEVQTMRQNSDVMRIELTEKTSEYESKILRLNEKIEILTNEVNALTKKNDELQPLQDQCANSIQKISELLESRDQEIIVLKTQLTDLESEKIQLQDKFRAIIDDLNEVIDRNLKNSGILSQALDEKESIIDKLNSLLSSLEQVIQSKTDKITELQGTIDKYISSLELKNSELETYEKKITTLENIILEKEETIRLKDNLAIERESIINKSVSDLQFCSSQVENQDQLQAQIQSLNEELIILREALQNVKKESDDIYFNLSKEIEKNNVLESTLSLKQKHLETLEKDLDDQIKVVNDLATKLEQVQNQQSTLEHSSASDELPVFTMNDTDTTDVTNLKQQLQSKQEEIDILQSTIADNTLGCIIQDLQDNINTLYDEKDKLEKQIVEKDGEIQDLKNQLGSTSAEASGLQATEAPSVREKRSLFENEPESFISQDILNKKEDEIRELENKVKLLELQQKGETDQVYEVQQMRQQFSADIYEKQHEIETYKFTISELQSEIANLRGLERLSSEDKATIYKLMSEKEEIRLNAEDSIQVILKDKENEISVLKNQISEETKELMNSLNLKDKDIENLKIQMNQTVTYYEEEFHRKNEDFNQLQAKVENLEHTLAEISITKDTEIYNLNIQIQEKNSRIEELAVLSEEESKQLTELRDLLQIKEQQLNGLQEQLEEKTKEYELIRHAIQRHRVSKTDTEEGATAEPLPPTANELDIALYMLHQRDVRCEELTRELTQLLEERDTLQLRLSNAIRINEELRRLATNSSSPKTEAELSAIASLTIPAPSKSEDPVEMAKEAINSSIGEDKDALAQKLLQLRSLDQNRDVRIWDDRELRHTQQMSLLTHKDVLSTLPPEAAAKIVNANYTLSRDVQSQSSVLLNWLWGKSTPKVVHM